MNYLSYRNIKKEAKTKMKGNWVSAIIVLLIAFLLSNLFNFITYDYTLDSMLNSLEMFEQFERLAEFDEMNEFQRAEELERMEQLTKGVKQPPPYIHLLSLLMILITAPLTYGINTFFLNVVRDNKPRIEDVFNGFRERFGSSVILTLLISLFTFLWSLLLFIPGIIASIRYTMAYYLLKDYDNISAINAISLSKEIMKGNKGRFFGFVLSFLGWFLLGIITFGIAFIYLNPYYNASKASFYEDLISKVSEETINKYLD